MLWNEGRNTLHVTLLVIGPVRWSGVAHMFFRSFSITPWITVTGEGSCDNHTPLFARIHTLSLRLSRIRSASVKSRDCLTTLVCDRFCNSFDNVGKSKSALIFLTFDRSLPRIIPLYTHSHDFCHTNGWPLPFVTHAPTPCNYLHK